MRVHLKKLVLVWCVSVLVLGNAHVSFADAMTDVEAFFSAQESYSRMIDVPGRGLMRYYAQNDSLWGDLAYEKEDTSSRRPFRDSGCSPSSLAMAVASLIPEESLSVISRYAKREYSLCSCSINKARCTHSHTRYLLTTPRDFARFLPLVFGDFAAGNNTLGVVSRSSAVGTGGAYIAQIAKVYGLNLRTLKNYQDARKLVGKKNTAVIALAGRHGAFTTTGHYIFFAAKDKDNMYILDPMLRKNYRGYPKGSKLKVIQPGLVAMRHKDNGIADFSSFIILEKKASEKK